MRFWRKSNDAVAAVEDETPAEPVPSWPKMDEPAIRSQMRSIVEKRIQAHSAERAAAEAAYPAKLAEWEAGIAAEIQSRIPAMIEVLKKRYPYGIGIGVDRVWYSTYEEEQTLSIRSAPERPSSDDYWEKRQQAIIEFLDMVPTEELTPEHRRILHQLGASYD